MKKVLFTATVDSHILHFHIPYLKMFKEKGYEVHVATNGDKEIPYCDVKHKISFERSPFKINNFKAIKELKKIINEEKFEIIHTHTPMGSVVTRLAAKEARKKGTRVIYTAHGFHFYKGAPLINWMLFYPIEKILSYITDDLITINQEDYERAKKKLHAKHTHYIPGVGVDPKKFDFEMSEQEELKLRESLGLKKDDFVMIYVAELNKNKNQIMAIKAMKELVKENKNIKLLLVGKGNLQDYYKNLVKKINLERSIIFTGYRTDVPQLMKISDIAISTSLREGLGLNLVEAMISKLPIIAVENRGHKELIENNYNGFIIKEYDIKTFENKILELYTISELKNKCTINCLKYSNKFLLNNVLKKIKEIYWKTEKTNKNILFVHDGYLKKDNDNKYYTIGGFGGKEFNKKYLLNNKDKLVYYTRLENIEKAQNKDYILIDNSKAKVKSTTTYKGPLDLFTKYFKIKKEIKGVLCNIDFAIIRMPSVLGTLTFFETKKKNIPAFVEMVGCPFQSLIYYGNIKGYLFAPIMWYLTRKVVKKSKYVHYVTKDYLQKKYPNQNGINLDCSDVVLENFENNILENRIKKIQHKKVNDTYKLGIVGSLDLNYKGHDVAIKAVSQLKDKYKLELHFLGSGKKEKWINMAEKYGVKDNIFFDGVLKSGEPVLNWLDNLDIHLMMSKTEGLPRTLLEAMSRASITIASNVGGIPELINKENLLDKNDYKGLANKIEKIINNKELQIKIAKENFEKSKLYSYKKLNNKRMQYYKNIMIKENIYDD